MTYDSSYVDWYESQSFASPAMASTIISEAMHGVIPEMVAEKSFDADGDSDEIGEVHTVYNSRSDRFDVQAALSADEYRAVMSKVAEESRPPVQENASQPAADSAE